MVGTGNYAHNNIIVTISSYVVSLEVYNFDEQEVAPNNGLKLFRGLKPCYFVTISNYVVSLEVISTTESKTLQTRTRNQ